jgi:hypothetical protein
MAEESLSALLDGLRLALAYNPLFALVGAAVAAGLGGSRRAENRHGAWAAGALAIAWVVGDGTRVVARARDVYDGVAFLVAPPGALWLNYVVVAVWALGGLALGYAIPALLGAFVGHRVTHGTGWISAVSVAVAASLALSALVAVLVG